jgi:hypothetical protein
VHMWSAKTLHGEQWTEENEVVAIDGEAPSSSSISQRFSKAFDDSPDAANVKGYLTTESSADDGSLSRDAIQLWAKKAEEAHREFGWEGSDKIAELDRALAYYARAPQPGTPGVASATLVPDTIAWHDETAIIARLNDAMTELQYFPSARDDNRFKRMIKLYKTPDHSVETILDWRGYFGANSFVTDCWTPFEQEARRYFVQMRLTAGYIVGTVLRRITRKQNTLLADPTRTERLTLMSEVHSNIADKYRDLSQITPRQHDKVIVFVHGTLSCGLEGLQHLTNLAVPIYRYEHDTFARIESNGTELADLIRENLDAKQLLFIAHSRGGLVARIAISKLQPTYPGAVQLFTFGTPHRGTPLVNVGVGALRTLYYSGARIVNGIPSVPSLTKSYSYLLNMRDWPDGIEVMRENSPSLSLLNSMTSPAGVSCWGSEFDFNKGKGYGLELNNVLSGAIGKIAHDLIVPTESALAFGSQQPRLNCAHSGYFEMQQVRDAINAFAALPAPAVATTASAAAPLKRSTTLKLKTQAAANEPAQSIAAPDTVVQN